MKKSGSCNVCRSRLESGLDFGEQPIANQLSETDSIEVAKYRLGVTACRRCGLVQLTDPLSPSLFYENYATPSSWKAEPHTPRLLGHLERMVPKKAKILDVGCNDGVFLSLLREHGWIHTSGLEPTRNTAEVCRQRGFEVIEAPLTSRLAGDLVSRDGKWDCVVLRQVLEHIVDLHDFGHALSTLVVEGGLLVIEVPDGRVNLQERDYGIWEEHSNYFTPDFLMSFLQNFGFEVQVSYESLFSSVCLSVIARRNSDEVSANHVYVADKNLARRQNDVFDRWASEFSEVKYRLRESIREVAQGGPVILYGVGCRSTNFINIMEASEFIDVAVDSQQGKQGKYVPGTRLRIVSPEEYRHEQATPATVLLGVNAENESRVIDEARVEASAWFSILPPSSRLLPGWFD